MRRGYLLRAEKAQHAAQVGCHSHRRRGQASTRAHCSAETLLLIFGRLLFFDLRCILINEERIEEAKLGPQRSKSIAFRDHVDLRKELCFITSGEARVNAPTARL